MQGGFLSKMALLFLQPLSPQGSSATRGRGAALSVFWGLKESSAVVEKIQGWG